MVGAMGLKGFYATLVEWDYTLAEIDKNIDSIELNVAITTQSQKHFLLPAFYRGNGRWSVRYLPKELGLYHVVTECKDARLNGIKRTLEVFESDKPYPRELFVSDNKRHLVDASGKPFFWLSDTWWMALSDRLDFESFRKLAQKRKEQGFNVIQLVAGLFPDMDSFDVRGKNSAGFPWNKDYSSINPSYFDEADKKILYLLEEGFTLCILGSWGYYLKKMGLQKMQQHWRNIIARWGAYPIVWCLAGEATMPYYLSSKRAKEESELKDGWKQMAQYIRSIEPFGNLITLHPMQSSLYEIEANLIDINLLQASHFGYESVSKGVALLRESKAKMPTIMDEINYEGILRNTHDQVQRLGFWASVLSGSCGFGYGANGIWQINREGAPFGASPNGANWGNTPLERAINFEGAKQLGKAKELLEQFAWQELVPMQESLEPKVDNSDPTAPYVAGIGDALRIAYFYKPIAPWDSRYIFRRLEPKQVYQCRFWDPQNFRFCSDEYMRANSEGEIQMPLPPSLDDWVLVLQKSEKESKRESFIEKRSLKIKLKRVIEKMKLWKW